MPIDDECNCDQALALREERDRLIDLNAKLTRDVEAKEAECIALHKCCTVLLRRIGEMS